MATATPTRKNGRPAGAAHSWDECVTVATACVRLTAVRRVDAALAKLEAAVGASTVSIRVVKRCIRELDAANKELDRAERSTLSTPAVRGIGIKAMAKIKCVLDECCVGCS